jgi:hypothetical protein
VDGANVDVSELYAASIFRVEVYRGEFLLTSVSNPKRKTLGGPTGTVDQESWANKETTLLWAKEWVGNRCSPLD